MNDIIRCNISQCQRLFQDPHEADFSESRYIRGLYASCAAALAASLCAFSCSAFSLSSFSLWMRCFFSASQAGTRVSYHSRSDLSAEGRFSWARAVTNPWKGVGSTLP